MFATNSANGVRNVLRAIMKHAAETKLRADDRTHDIKAVRVKSPGYHSWSDEEIAQFENWHPIGSRARLALALLLYTGYRSASLGCGAHGTATHPRGWVAHLPAEDRRRPPFARSRDRLPAWTRRTLRSRQSRQRKCDLERGPKGQHSQKSVPCGAVTAPSGNSVQCNGSVSGARAPTGVRREFQVSIEEGAMW